MIASTLSNTPQLAKMPSRPTIHRWALPATALGLISFSIALTFPKASHAQVGILYDWDEPAGGAYASNANWLPSGIPDNNTEGARFNLNATYSVQLPASNVTVRSLTGAQGEVDLVFASPPSLIDPPYTYTTNFLSVNSTAGGSPALNLLRGRTIVNSSLTIASTGQALLNLLDAGLTTSSATLGVNPGSEGYLAIGDQSNWSGAGTQIIGAAGTGRIEIMASYRGFGILGQPLIFSPTQGTATTSATVLGQSAGSNGVATVNGLWNTGDLTVGDAGAAEVNVLANAFSVTSGVNVSSAGKLDSGTVSIAAQPGSFGTVNVTGFAFHFLAGVMASEWEISGNLALGGVSAAAGGTGQLLVGEFNTVSVGSSLRIWTGGKLSIAQAANISVAGAANLAGTLEFVPPPAFNPQVNDEFGVLTAAGGVAGAFTSTILPPLSSELAWSVRYNPTSVVLKIVQAADFDEDGDVDGADFTKWRMGFGTSSNATHMQGDANADGDADGGDFLVWQRQLGGNPPAAGASAAVPEPATWMLMTVALPLLARRLGYAQPSALLSHD